jgi:hypothetical protein
VLGDEGVEDEGVLEVLDEVEEVIGAVRREGTGGGGSGGIGAFEYLSVNSMTLHIMR